MNHVKSSLLLIFVSMLSAACSSELLPKYTVVQGLRVLALQSDVPEMNYDGTSFSSSVVITPLISDLYGGGRVLHYNLEWCLDPGIAVGAKPTCVGNPTRTVIQSDATVASTGGSTFVAPNYTGSIDADTIDFSTGGASTLALLSQKYASSTTSQLFNGFAILIVYEIYPNGDLASKVSALKRIVLSGAGKTTKNSNPSGLEIRNSGTEISSLPSIESSMEAYLPSSQAEVYSFMSASGSVGNKTEVLETTWFLTGPADIPCSKKKECTTDGLFSMSRTRLGELNTFYIPEVAVPTTRGRVLIAVARDDRGGVVSKRYCTGVCP